MKADVRAKQRRATLNAEEVSLRARLLEILPGAASGGAQLFLNSANSPKPIAHHSHEVADEMYACARRCVELRTALGLEADLGVAGYFLAACDEAASAHPHRRGPRKLAAWLLTKVLT
jgi:hypothetical protein